MKIVVGLGNPGQQYVGTRHNVGFEVIAELAKRHWSGRHWSGRHWSGRHWSGSRPQVKHQAEIAEVQIGAEKVLLVSPLTYMNSSGRSIKPLLDFFKLSLDNLIIISDDLSLPTGHLRLRGKGSSGGQKGLESIIECVGSDEFPRLKIGIDPTPPQWSTSDYVLGKFAPEQRPVIDEAVQRAADAIQFWVQGDLLACMNRFNTKKEKAEKKSKAKPSPSDPDSADPQSASKS